MSDTSTPPSTEALELTKTSISDLRKAGALDGVSAQAISIALELEDRSTARTIFEGKLKQLHADQNADDAGGEGDVQEDGTDGELVEHDHEPVSAEDESAKRQEKWILTVHSGGQHNWFKVEKDEGDLAVREIIKANRSRPSSMTILRQSNGSKVAFRRADATRLSPTNVEENEQPNIWFAFESGGGAYFRVPKEDLQHIVKFAIVQRSGNILRFKDAAGAEVHVFNVASVTYFDD